MGFYLESIHMRNFKLFSDKIVQFENNLNIFDGANGYGKTSSFDAIEYALTGSIDRIINKAKVDGKFAFDNDCLEKIPSDGEQTSVVATLKDGKNNRLVITRRLDKGTGKENNPSKIRERTKTTIELNNNIILENEDLAKSQCKLLDILGQDLPNLYNKFYYIPQENRLSFLSKSNKERMKEIQTLFNIEREESNMNKIKEVKTKFTNLNTRLNTQIEKEKNTLKVKQREIENLNNEEIRVQYNRLINNIENELVWDKEKITIKSKEKLLELQEEVRGIESFTNNFGEFLIDKKNEWIKNLSNDKNSIGKYLFLNRYDGNLETFKNEIDRYDKVVQSLVYRKDNKEELDYENIRYGILKDILKLNIDISEIEGIKKEIKNYKSKVNDEDIAKNNLLKLQRDMIRVRDRLLKSDSEYIDEKECPFCGYEWDSKDELESNINAIHKVIEDSQCKNQKLLDEETRKLELIYNNDIKEKIKEFISKYKYCDSDLCREIQKSLETEKVKYELFIDSCNKYSIKDGINFLNKDKIETWSSDIQEFINDIQGELKELSKDYHTSSNVYNYDNIFKKVYDENEERVKIFKKCDIRDKISYLEQLYYLSQSTEIERMEEKIGKYNKQSDKLKNILKDITDAEEILKEELKQHKDNIVKHLQAPFYLYSGRILQNYPGGLGIKMKNEKDNISFEATNRPGHDVFYTLSSGQLSAIVVALTMTLSKVYTDGRFRCMLIDDPFQTMDELNIASFVELLRNDFTNYQFIFSTHEPNFSDYIRYKFEKYGLTNKSILIQDNSI